MVLGRTDVDVIVDPLRNSSVGHAIGHLRRRAASMSAIVRRRKESETLVNEEPVTNEENLVNEEKLINEDSGIQSISKEENDPNDGCGERKRTISFSNPIYDSDDEGKDGDTFCVEETSFRGDNSTSRRGIKKSTNGSIKNKKKVSSFRSSSSKSQNQSDDQLIQLEVSQLTDQSESPHQRSGDDFDTSTGHFDTLEQSEEERNWRKRGRKVSFVKSLNKRFVSMDTNNNTGRRHTIAASTIHHIHRLLETPDDLSTASKFHSRLHGINERPADFESNPSLGGGTRKEYDTESCTDQLSKHSKEETVWSVLKELIVAFLLAGLGNVAAAYMLTRVRTWSVFKNIPQLFILVQPLLGLKGNVEMTLASRLSTHANLGDLDTTKGKRSIIFGNMALVQCQASSVGFVAPFVALVLSLVSEENRGISFKEIILLTSSSVITANLANLLLGTVMCCTVVACRKYKVNPDNIATPIAASLGDVTTMILLANISHFLYVNLDHNSWIQNTLLIFLMSLIPIWAYIARKNPFTSSVILTGWFPVCGAMLLQNAGGLVMERALGAFERLTMFQPVINGIGGNLVAIQASRMSTHLHKFSAPKELPRNDPTPWTYPGFTFINKYSAHTTMARLLILLVGPSQVIFVLVTKLVNNKNFDITPVFMIVYVMIAIIQVAILLQIAYNLVHWLWKLGIDPDNSAIPFLTAFADLIGSILLASAFVFLMSIGDPNAVVQSAHAHHDSSVSDTDLPSMIATTLIYENSSLIHTFT